MIGFLMVILTCVVAAWYLGIVSNPIKVVELKGDIYRVDKIQRKVWKGIFLDSGRMIWDPNSVSPEENHQALVKVLGSEGTPREGSRER